LHHMCARFVYGRSHLAIMAFGTLSGDLISWVDELRYLGVIISLSA